MKSARHLILGCFFLAAVVTLLMPQAGYARDKTMETQVAGLQEDMEILRRQVGQLQLEVESIRRENARLVAAMKQLQAEQAGTLTAFKDSLGTSSKLTQQLRRQWEEADEAQKKAVLKAVEAQVADLASQTQAALDKLAKAVAAEPSLLKTKTPAFSNDYPREGIAYTVLQGDTLSGIARKFGSSVRDIQNANRIADPARDLQAGQTIFIPQRTPTQ